MENYKLYQFSCFSNLDSCHCSSTRYMFPKNAQKCRTRLQKMVYGNIMYNWQVHCEHQNILVRGTFCLVMYKCAGILILRTSCGRCLTLMKRFRWYKSGDRKSYTDEVKKTPKTDVRNIMCGNLWTLRFLAGVCLKLIYPGLPGCACLTGSEMSG